MSYYHSLSTFKSDIRLNENQWKRRANQTYTNLISCTGVQSHTTFLARLHSTLALQCQCQWSDRTQSNNAASFRLNRALGCGEAITRDAHHALEHNTRLVIQVLLTYNACMRVRSMVWHNVAGPHTDAAVDWKTVTPTCWAGFLAGWLADILSWCTLRALRLFSMHSTWACD